MFTPSKSIAWSFDFLDFFTKLDPEPKLGDVALICRYALCKSCGQFELCAGIGTYPATLNKPSDQIGWIVTQTWENISGHKIRSTSGGQDNPTGHPGNMYVSTNVTDEYLATQGGSNASTANVNFGFQLSSVVPRDDWAPGQSGTLKQLFSWPAFDPTDKPIRLLVTFNDKLQNATPGVPHYQKPADFRIDLTCTK